MLEPSKKEKIRNAISTFIVMCLVVVFFASIWGFIFYIAANYIFKIPVAFLDAVIAGGLCHVSLGLIKVALTE